MKAVFADSFYFFALLNPHDEAHRDALEIAHAFHGLIVSTAWVFTELGDGLSHPRDRPAFVRLLRRFSQNPMCKLLPPTPELFRAGAALFQNRADKDWSLTDCISFVAMGEEKLTDALTGDHHFLQAGFNALLARPVR
ncbi:MAG TPA: PIN domain-containing protein [Phycisphaerae bacterium]|nr:PIN domain-containing protein [Phycisphaerae bacterium]